MGNNHKILIIEDNEDHAFLIEKLLEEYNLSSNLHHIADGQEAINYLFSNNNVKPNLILLDLKLPKIMGYEILRIIKENNELESIPVIILTSSTEKDDMETCKMLGADGYISKLNMFDTLIEKVKEVLERKKLLA